MPVDIRLPKAGDSITEAFIGQWQVKEGTWVDVDQNIVVIETEKAAFDVPAPVAGILSKTLKKNGDKALVNEVIAQIDPAPRPANVAPAATPAPVLVVPVPAAPCRRCARRPGCAGRRTTARAARDVMSRWGTPRDPQGLRRAQEAGCQCPQGC